MTSSETAPKKHQVRNGVFNLKLNITKQRKKSGDNIVTSGIFYYIFPNMLIGNIAAKMHVTIQMIPQTIRMHTEYFEISASIS